MLRLGKYIVLQKWIAPDDMTWRWKLETIVNYLYRISELQLRLVRGAEIAIDFHGQEKFTILVLKDRSANTFSAKIWLWSSLLNAIVAYHILYTNLIEATCFSHSKHTGDDF